MYTQKNAFLLVLMLGALSLQPVYGQRQKFQKLDIAAGLGVFPTFLKDQGRMVTPPLSLQVDYRPAKNLSLGFFLGFSSTESRQDMVGETTTVLLHNRFSSGGLRLAAHTDRFENWDVYGGFILGYMHSNIEILQGDPEKVRRHQGIQPSSGKVVLSGMVGSRFTLGPHLGLFAEAGFGVSLLRTGISFRL